MSAPPPDLPEFLRRWSRGHGGIDPHASPLVLGWLRVVHALARPLAARRVAPSALTAASVAAALGATATALPGGRWALLGVALVAATGLLDGLDGAVAVMTGRASAWGRVLDPLADRVGDLALLGALVLLGGPAVLAVGVGALTLLLESVRTSAQVAGMAGVGVVTVWERPSRLIVAAFGLLGAGATPGLGPAAVTVSLGLAGVLAVLGSGQLLVTVRRRLRA